MRTLKVWPLVLACLAAYATAPIAAAQQQDRTAPPPPQLENLEEGEAPSITIRKPEAGQQSEEKRAPGGKVTEIKVTSGGSTYYLKSNDQAGSALPGDIQSSTLRGAQWEVLTFDLGRPQEARTPEAVDVSTPAPPTISEPSGGQQK